MYIPEYYKQEDLESIYKFIRENPFGTIVSIDGKKPLAIHIPIELQEDENGKYYLHGHISKGNPQWRSFEEQEKVLLIFQGPHAYVSSSWYQIEEVPTWNYQAVHVYGKLTVLKLEDVISDLARLLERYESTQDNPQTWDKMSDETKKQMHGIVGFKVSLDEIHAASKLSQNRSEDDYRSIIDRLNNSSYIEDQQIAQAMQNKLEL